MATLPDKFLRKSDGPRRPPTPPGQDAPPSPSLLTPSAVQKLLQGRTDVAQSAAPGPPAQADVASEVQDMLEGMRASVAALDPSLPLSAVGQILYSEANLLDAKTLSVLQPVIDDMRITAQNAVDSGAASTAPQPHTPSPTLLATITDFVTSQGKAALAHFANGLQNKVDADIDSHNTAQVRDGRVNADVVGGYASLLKRAVGMASDVASGKPAQWDQSSGALPYDADPGIVATVSGMTQHTSTAYLSVMSQVLASHRILGHSLESQRAFSQALQKDLTLLQAILGASGGATGDDLLKSIGRLSPDILKQVQKRYEANLRRTARPTSSALPTFTPALDGSAGAPDEDNPFIDVPGLPILPESPLAFTG